MKVIILVKKKEKEAALLWIRTHNLYILEVKSAYHGSFIMNLNFFKCYKIEMITFMPCNIFERICYSEFILKTKEHFILKSYLQWLEALASKSPLVPASMYVHLGSVQIAYFEGRYTRHTDYQKDELIFQVA